MSFATDLAALMEAAQIYPPPGEFDIWRQIQVWQALRDSDSEFLQNMVGWKLGRPYLIDPLAQAISEAFAGLIYGASPTLLASDQADQVNLDTLADNTNLAAELQRGVGISVSEGEVWWRIFADAGVSDYPLIEMHSRHDIVPLWKSRRLLAVAFVSEIARYQVEIYKPAVVWRHVEYHEDGGVLNRLYYGNAGSLGVPMDLSDRPETADLVDYWPHGLAMLAGRIPNRLQKVYEVGVSDLAGVKSLLLSLNEAAVVAYENMRLTAKKRLFVSGSLTDAKGNLQDGDIFNVDTLDMEMGGTGGKPPVSAVEYSYDADALNSHTQALVDTICTRVGVTRELVGRGDPTEVPVSGAALHARMLTSVQTAEGKARYWDSSTPYFIGLAQMVDALPRKLGGFGRKWAASQFMPTVTRPDPLPADPTDTANRHVALVAGGVESKETAIGRLNPDWTDEQVKEELKRIESDQQSMIPAQLTPFAGQQPNANQRQQQTNLIGQIQRNNQQQQFDQGNADKQAAGKGANDGGKAGNDGN